MILCVYFISGPHDTLGFLYLRASWYFGFVVPQDLMIVCVSIISGPHDTLSLFFLRTSWYFGFFVPQDLTISLACDQPVSEVVLREDLDEPSGVNNTAFSLTQEWALAKRVHTWKKITTKKANSTVIKHQSFCVAVKVVRRPQFFLYNVVIILVSAHTFFLSVQSLYF